MSEQGSKPDQKQSPEEWRKLVELYQSKDCTKSEFLERHGLNSWTLQYHVEKYSRKGKSFTPVVNATIASNPAVEISFPSGISLIIRG